MTSIQAQRLQYSKFKGKEYLDTVHLLRENSQEVIREVAKQRRIPIAVASNLSVTWWGPCLKPSKDTVSIRAEMC